MSSVQKTSLLVGILVIIGVGAFVYFDPMDLNLQGLKQKPAAAAPKSAIAPTRTKASVAVPRPAPSPAPAATSPAAAPKVAAAPTQAKAPAAATPPAPSPTAAPAATPAAAPPVAAAAQVPQQPMKLSKVTMTASKPAIDKPTRAKNQDLRHCLDLETDAAIAKCAGE